MGGKHWEILTGVVDWSRCGEGCHSQKGGQDVLGMHGEERFWCCRGDTYLRTVSWKKGDWLNELPR